MPSLSELSAVYNQQPYAPAQGTNNQLQQGFSQLGQGIDNAREQARQNKPVSPWQKAVMRLMAGHDPKDVADDTKAELGGQGLSGQSQMPVTAPNAPQQNAVMPPGPTNLGQTPPPSYGPPTAQMAGSQMPSVSVSRQPMSTNGDPMRTPLNANQSFTVDRVNAAEQARNQASQQPQEDIYAGMNNRDFGDYMSAMNMVRSHQPKQERDYLEEQRLRNEGVATVASLRGGAQIGAAQIGGDARVEASQNAAGAKDNATAAKAESDKNKLDEQKVRNKEYERKNKAFQDYLWSKLKVADEWHKDQSSKDPVLTILQKQASDAASTYKGNSSQPLETLTDEGKRQIEASKADYVAKVKKVEDYIASHPSHNIDSSESRSSSMSGTSKSLNQSVDTFKMHGHTYKVLKRNEKGEIAAYDNNPID